MPYNLTVLQMLAWSPARIGMRWQVVAASLPSDVIEEVENAYCLHFAGC